jgi:hypothetical protein
MDRLQSAPAAINARFAWNMKSFLSNAAYYTVRYSNSRVNQRRDCKFYA